MDKRIDIRADVVYDDIIILPVEGEVEITENGVHDVAQYETANVNVPTTNPEPLSVTENGTYAAPEGKSYSPVTVNVPEIELIPLNVSTNPYISYAPEGKGYSPVTVNIPFSGTLDIYENGVHLCEGYAAVNVMVPETELVPLSATENKTYTPPGGKGFSSVTVDVPPAIELVPLTVESNGAVYVAPEGKGYSPVTVDIPEVTVIPELQVTKNGTYTAQTGEAYGSVTVNVKAYAEETLLWENPSPRSAFGAQSADINIGANAYDYYKVVELPAATIPGNEKSFLCGADETSGASLHQALIGGQNNTIYLRPFFITNLNDETVRFLFQDCTKVDEGRVLNSFMVPQKIYGLKMKGVSQ